MSLKATAMGQQMSTLRRARRSGHAASVGDGQQVPISIGNRPVAADPLIGTIIGERFTTS